MAVYVKRRRIVFLIIACFVIYIIFNLILMGRSTRKSYNKNLEKIQENTLLSSRESDLDMPEDYKINLNYDDYFFSEDETLLSTHNDQSHLRHPKKSKGHHRNIFSTKTDMHVEKNIYHTEFIPNVEIVVEKPELYHTMAENPESVFDAFDIKNFDAIGTTRARIYNRKEPGNKENIPLLAIDKENILPSKHLTVPPQNPDSQGYPELKPELYHTVVETNPESDFDALELTDSELTGTNNARTYAPIGPDSIIPIPKRVIEKETIFHSKALTITPQRPDSQVFSIFKLFNQSESMLPTTVAGILKVQNLTIKIFLSEIKFKETATVPHQQPDLQKYSEFENISHNNTKTPITKIEKPTKNPALIIDTSGCKIPKLDPWDPTVMSFVQIFGPYKCSFPPLFMTPEPNGIINLNASVLEKYYNATPDAASCWYQPIVRTYLSTNNREDDYGVLPVEELKFGELIEHDHLITKCFFKNYTHEQYIPLVRLKEEVENRKQALKSPSPLNVIVVGIDSVSKLNFMRRFFHTKPYLKFKMKAFDMKGYTKVGDNTFPNLVPMLTGHFSHYFWNDSNKETYFFDNMPFIWKEYSRYGHRTFFAEDDPYHGSFNFLKRGFLEPPTDYYYRTLALAIEQSELRKKGYETNSACLNSELETDIMYKYLVNFVKTMGTRPYFAFCFTSALTHDFFDAAGFADAPAAKLLNDLDNAGALNSSALIMFSDHGIRYGEIRQTYIGKFEERMPFMYIHFPKWFLDQHPDFERNLATNQDRLITLFDIHATLKHLLHINDGFIKEDDELGLSLFDEIPENRNCADAHIQEHYCPCNSFNKVSVDTPEVYMVSFALIDHINSLLVNFTDMCEVLILDEIKDARLGLPNEIVLKLEEEEDLLINKTQVIGEAPPTLGDYLITLSVKPGGAIFEGTVRYDAENLFPKVFGVSRINMYGTQSWCIDSQVLKLFCYCKVQPF